MIVITYVELLCRKGYGSLPGDISRPRKGQVMYMLRKIKDREDPEAPFQVPVQWSKL